MHIFPIFFVKYKTMKCGLRLLYSTVLYGTLTIKYHYLYFFIFYLWRCDQYAGITILSL